MSLKQSVVVKHDRKAEFIAHLCAIGFMESEVRDVALVLYHVREEPGFHLWRFNPTLRAIALRLVTVGLLRKEKNDLHLQLE